MGTMNSMKYHCLPAQTTVPGTKAGVWFRTQIPASPTPAPALFALLWWIKGITDRELLFMSLNKATSPFHLGDGERKQRNESWGLFVYVFWDISVYQHRNLTCSVLLKDKCVLRGCWGENSPTAKVGERCLLCSSVSGIKTITWHNANSRAQIRLAVDFLKEY